MNSQFEKCVVKSVDAKQNELREALKGIFFKLIDEKAMQFLCKRISSQSGDIRVVFDVMKNAFTILLSQIKSLPANLFEMKNLQQL